MAVEQKYITNNVQLPVDDGFNDDKIFVCGGEINISDAQVKDYVPIEDSKISIVDIKQQSTELYGSTHDVILEDKENVLGEIKIEFDNNWLFCECCEVYYEDYCITCTMLVCILNKNILHNADTKIQEELPRNILEIKGFSGQLGIFALKVIPKGVKFGPFTGLNASEGHYKIKGGRFMISEDKSMNWMSYINPARSICEQNLCVFQCDGNLHYRSDRDIHVGEELLIYFSEKCEESLNRDNQVDFIPAIENDVKDVFACTFCCLGFSTRMHLSKHKTVCLNADEKFSTEELVQCPYCKIHLDMKEYSEYHMAFCCERNVRKCDPLVLNSQRLEEAKKLRRNSEFKGRRRREYKCLRCKCETTYKADFVSHINSHHCIVKRYKCALCIRRFKTIASLKVHVDDIHVNVEGSEDQSASNSSACACQFHTRYTAPFKRLTETKQLEETRLKCVSCDYQADDTSQLDIHVKTKHVAVFHHECEMCQFKTNQKVLFEYHLKIAHLKEWSERLKEFDFKCLKCNYKTNNKICLNSHVKTKHLKVFDIKCLKCNYETNYKPHLTNHMKAIHRMECYYKCLECHYQTNHKQWLKSHMKTIHLKVFDFKCMKCKYKTYSKEDLNSHMKAKHLTECYKCLKCHFRTNYKSGLTNHMKSKMHFSKFNYKFVHYKLESLECNYETNAKTYSRKKHLLSS